MIIEADSLCFMYESFLVDDITLRFPLPDNNLPERLQSQTDPCTWGVDSKSADFVLPNWESLYFSELLIDQLIDGELSFTISWGEESIVGIIKDSFEILSRLGHN